MLAVAIGLLIGLVVRELPWLWIAAIALVAGATGATIRASVVGAILVGWIITPPTVQPLAERVFVEGVADVVSIPRVSTDTEVTVVQIGSHRYRARVSSSTSLGDRLRVAAVAEPFPETFRGQFTRRGWRGRLDLQHAVPVSEGATWWRLGKRWRDSFRQFTSQHLTKQSSQLADAVCFNVEGGLDDDLKDDLRKVGVVHIISASGLHVGIFAVFLQGVLSRLPIGRPWQLIILMLVLLLYMGATGMRPSIVRAVAMAGIMLTAYPWRREADLLPALGLAAIANLLLDGRAVWDIGFQLSFGAVLGIGLFPWYGKPTTGYATRWQDSVAQGAWISLIASVSTGPLVAYYFGYFSLVSVLANVVASLPVTMMVVGSLAGWAVFWVPGLPMAVMSVVEGACTAFLMVTRWMASWPFAAVELPPFSAAWLVPCWLVLAGLWRFRERPA